MVTYVDATRKVRRSPGVIPLHGEAGFAGMRKAGRLTAEALDLLADHAKPGVTTLAQLAEVRRVQAQTRRIYSILYGGRPESPATQRAVELVHAGAIGQVVHTMGAGPHKIGENRADWFWNSEQFGGVLGGLGDFIGGDRT